MDDTKKEDTEKEDTPKSPLSDLISLFKSSVEETSSG